MDLSQAEVSNLGKEGKRFMFIHPETGEEFPEVELTIASNSNPKYTRAHDAIVNSAAVDIQQKGKKAAKKAVTRRKEKLLEAIAEHVLLDFKGIQINGRMMNPNDPEDRLLVCKAPFLLDFIEEAASDYSNFQEEELKNSEDSPQVGSESPQT